MVSKMFDIFIFVCVFLKCFLGKHETEKLPQLFCFEPFLTICQLNINIDESTLSRLLYSTHKGNCTKMNNNDVSNLNIMNCNVFQKCEQYNREVRFI